MDKKGVCLSGFIATIVKRVEEEESGAAKENVKSAAKKQQIGIATCIGVEPSR